MSESTATADAPSSTDTAYRPNVLVADAIAEAGMDALETVCDVTRVPGWSADELLEEIHRFDAIVVRSATKVTADVIERGTKLKVVGRAGVGVDNVDLDAASQRGIVVVNAPTATVTTVAEHTIGLLFALARNIPQGHGALVEGNWERSKWKGVELSGKTLALLGLGRIGRAVADRARGLDMHVIAYDPFLAPDRFATLGVEHAPTIEEALMRGDFISLHLPLTDESRGMIDADALQLVQPHARIVNTARGGLIDLDALHDALANGGMAGAALDVFPVEPPPPHPIFSLPNVVTTPHLAASTAEAQDRAGIAVADQVIAALTGGVVTTAVNVPNIAPETIEALQPFVPLVSRMATLAEALAGPGASAVTVEAWGEIADWDERMLLLAALTGLLRDSSDEPVTFVNALSIAEARGIATAVSADRAERDYQNLIRVTVAGSEGEFSVEGTTLGAEHRPWLVSVDQFTVEMELSGDVALFAYDDVPGMIGRIGTAFGNAGVNIATMAVSRSDAQAMMAITFDSPPDIDVVSRIAESDGFMWGLSVRL